MIRKILIRVVTYREAAHLCKTSCGSISLEAKEMREEFRSCKLPKYLSVDDVRTSPFFAGESREAFNKVADNLVKNQLPPELPPLPQPKNQ